MNLSDYKITTKLVASFILVALIGALVSLMAVGQMGKINHADTLLYQQELVGLSHIKEAKFGLMASGGQVRTALLAPSKKQRDQALSDLADSVKKTKQEIDLAAPLINSSEGKAKLTQLQGVWGEYEALMRKLDEMVRKEAIDSSNETGQFLLGDATKTVLQVQDLLSALATDKEAAAKASSESNDAIYANSRNLTLFLALVGLGLGVGLGLWISRHVTAPLARAVEGAQRMSEGDMTQELRASGKDEVVQLLNALEAMRVSLRDIVTTVRGNAESVATASAQISQGNADLSQRTEEQASALEETAATMDELSSTVRNNADNARQAAQLSANASEVAVQGGSVVEEVVSTMRGINDSSKRIADIIATIDGIAFQTNILALNAAVEAARAGEQGRGFAVVASEVRSLAQRSGEAAKEIRGLITASVEQVEAGTQLADKAGHTMQDVVGAIRRVNDIVGEIASASGEQSQGIAQVGEAITQMDKVTQQNAALVEESAAAAESMKQQAQALVQSVSLFRVGAEAARSAATPAPRPAVASAAAATHQPSFKAAFKAPAASTTAPRPAAAQSKPALNPAPRPAAQPAAPKPAAPAPAPRPAPAADDGDWETF
jgi:methyl-accepting chemotaxis protein